VRERQRRARASQPHVDLDDLDARPGGSSPSGQRPHLAEAERERRRVWCESPRWRCRSSPNDTAGRRSAAPPSAERAFAASATASPPWPEREPVPTMPGPMPQTTTSAPRPRAWTSADGDVHALEVAVEARARRRSPFEEPRP
jgi:hypothetical protein